MSVLYGSRHLSGRLVNIIEGHAERLTRDTVTKLQAGPRTPSYERLSYEELSLRMNQIYRNLGRWLWENTDQMVRAWYNELGRVRFNEKIPLDEVLWAVTLSKHQLMDDLDACGLADSAMELYRQQEFERVIGNFFDRAVCYTAEGYEREAKLHARDHVGTAAA